MQEQVPAEKHISLAEVARIAPGRPSTNCVWRWCRRGVKSRTGERIRLQHVRMGGMIYTTARWLEEFGQELADADAKYFDLNQAFRDAAASPRRRQRVSEAQHEIQRKQAIEDAERELDAAGIR